MTSFRNTLYFKLFSSWMIKVMTGNMFMSIFWVLCNHLIYFLFWIVFMRLEIKSNETKTENEQTFLSKWPQHFVRDSSGRYDIVHHQICLFASKRFFTKAKDWECDDIHTLSFVRFFFAVSSYFEPIARHYYYCTNFSLLYLIAWKVLKL